MPRHAPCSHAARSYDAGQCHNIGAAHSGAVTALAVSPDRSRVVSVGEEGAVCVWAYAPPPPPPELGGAA